MCKAKSYVEQLIEIYNNINLEVNRLCKEEKMATLFDIDVLHEIENTNFNACEGYKLSKKIKENRVFRRKIKNELDTMLQLKNKFIDKNIELLKQISQEIVNRDNFLNELVDNKVYTPKAMNVNLNVSNSNFIPIPIPSEPRQPKEETMTLGTAIHKTTKAKLQVISKIDDNHYVVKKKCCGMQVMLSKNILNLEYLQTAK